MRRAGKQLESLTACAVRAVVMVAAVLGVYAAPLDAQEVSGEVRSRGVIILKAAPKPVEASPPVAIQEPAPAAPKIVEQPAPQPVVPAPPRTAPLAGPAAVVALPLQACPRPFVRPDLVLPIAAQAGGEDAREFNRALRRKLLAKRSPVVIDLSQAFSADKAPPATLVPWLARVKSSGGTVRTVQYCEQSRGFFSFFRRAFSSDDPGDYAAAESFDAFLHVDGLDQTVTQIEFRRREPAK
jgi:hypothetical protein